MFTGDQVQLDISFDAARDRLASLAQGWWLLDASRDSIGRGVIGYTRVGPLPGLAKLVSVHVERLPGSHDRAGLALRWEVPGPTGVLFPMLDADITLIPAQDGGSVLAIAAVYRPPLGALGAGLDRTVLHGIATATVRAFLNRAAEAILSPAVPATQAVCQDQQG